MASHRSTVSARTLGSGHSNRAGPRLRALAGLTIALLATSAGAQLTAAAEGPIAMGHHHLNTADLAASKAFWVDQLGGEAVKLGPLEVIKFPNLLVALTPKKPEGSSMGSSVNHIGVQVPDVEQVVERLKAAGVPVVTREHVPPAESEVFPLPDQDTRIAFVESPAGLRLELFENRALERPLENHHMHFFTTDPVATRNWYVEHFGAKPRMRGTFLSADLPGVNLTFSLGETTGTQGRALDHIGFEVDGLEALVERLQAQGVEFTRPYMRIDALGLGFAFFTDPWGTYVEITEGLDAL